MTDITPNSFIYEERPWGNFIIIGTTKNGDQDVVVKKLTVHSHKRLSYQSHEGRSEHWFIIQGVAEVELDGKQMALGAGESINSPVGTKHRIGNSADDDMVFVEIATGKFDEQDIVRYEDDFGRADESGVKEQKITEGINSED